MHMTRLTPIRHTFWHLVRAALASALLFAPSSALRAGEPASQMAAQRFETMFMKSMPDHHQMAVEMSRVCLEKTQRSELRQLCQQIIDSQTREQALLRSWLSTWYGMTMTPMLDRSGRMMVEEMRGMTAADFEKMYLQMMIRHHWMAVSEAGGCVERAHDLHRELEALCEGMVEDQVMEIRQMRDWLCQWYGNCNFRSDGDLHPRP